MTYPYGEPSIIPNLRFNLFPSLILAACNEAPSAIASSESKYQSRFLLWLYEATREPD